MKKTALIVLLLMFCFAIQFAMGDVKVVNEVKNLVNGKDQGSGENTSYYREDRMRTEMPGGASIIRLDKGVMWVINDKEKTYMEMTAEQMGALAGFMKQDEEPKIEKTEETKKIGKYNCQKFIVTIEIMGSKATTEIWATSDIKPDKTLMKFSEKMMEVFKENPTMKSNIAMNQEIYNLKMFPVMTTTKFKMMGMNSENSTMLKSITNEEVEDSMYEIPEGYEKQEMPTMGGMGDTGTKGVIKGKSKDVIKGKSK